VVAGPGLARGPRPEALPRTLSRDASIHPTADLFNSSQELSGLQPLSF